MLCCFLEVTVICLTLFVKCDTSREKSGSFCTKTWSSVRAAALEVMTRSSSIGSCRVCVPNEFERNFLIVGVCSQFLVGKFLVKTCTIDNQLPFFVCKINLSHVVKIQAFLLLETLNGYGSFISYNN